MKHSFSARVILLALLTSTGLAPLSAEPALGSQEKKKPTSGKTPMVKVKHSSLYKNSHILIYRGEHSIVPKHSILFLPEKLKTRVTDKPTGKFVLWPFFRRGNQDWIWTFEVTLDQAKGIKPLPKGTIEQFSKLNRVVIALYRGNPVSVLPPKEKNDNAESSAKTDKK